jgi:hypothetical protein
MREAAGGLAALERSAQGPALPYRALKLTLQLSGSATERIASGKPCRAATQNIAIRARKFIRTRKLGAGNFPSAALERIGAIEFADTTFRGTAAERLAPFLGSDRTRALVQADSAWLGIGPAPRGSIGPECLGSERVGVCSKAERLTGLGARAFPAINLLSMPSHAETDRCGNPHGQQQPRPDAAAAQGESITAWIWARGQVHEYSPPQL